MGASFSVRSDDREHRHLSPPKSRPSTRRHRPSSGDPWTRCRDAPARRALLDLISGALHNSLGGFPDNCGNDVGSAYTGGDAGNASGGPSPVDAGPVPAGSSPDDSGVTRSAIGKGSDDVRSPELGAPADTEIGAHTDTLPANNDSASTVAAPLDQTNRHIAESNTKDRRPRDTMNPPDSDGCDDYVRKVGPCHP